MGDTIEVDEKVLLDITKQLKGALEYWNQPYGEPTKPQVEQAKELVDKVRKGKLESIECFSKRCDESFSSASDMWHHLHFQHSWAANKKSNVVKRFHTAQLEG